MNISKTEQRVLLELAQGGAIRFARGANGKLTAADCFNREVHRLADCTLAIVLRLVNRGLIHSSCGAPYRISRKEREGVRPQLDNR